METVRFDSLGVSTEEEVSRRLKSEMDVFSTFEAFIVFDPIVKDQKKTNNSDSHSQQGI